MTLGEIIFAITQRLGVRQVRTEEQEFQGRHGGDAETLRERERVAEERFTEALRGIRL